MNLSLGSRANVVVPSIFSFSPSSLSLFDSPFHSPIRNFQPSNGEVMVMHHFENADDCYLTLTKIGSVNSMGDETGC